MLLAEQRANISGVQQAEFRRSARVPAPPGRKLVCSKDYRRYIHRVVDVGDHVLAVDLRITNRHVRCM